MLFPVRIVSQMRLMRIATFCTEKVQDASAKSFQRTWKSSKEGLLEVCIAFALAACTTGPHVHRELAFKQAHEQVNFDFEHL